MKVYEDTAGKLGREVCNKIIFLGAMVSVVLEVRLGWRRSVKDARQSYRRKKLTLVANWKKYMCNNSFLEARVSVVFGT